MFNDKIMVVDESTIKMPLKFWAKFIVLFPCHLYLFHGFGIAIQINIIFDLCYIFTSIVMRGINLNGMEDIFPSINYR